MSEEVATKSYDLSEWSIPGSFTWNGKLYPGFPFTQEDLEKTEAGDIPDFDFLVASFPRTGEYKRDIE